MRGHVTTKSGSWYAVLDVQDAATGKRKRKWVKLQAKNKREAQGECAELVAKQRTGSFVEPSKLKLAEFFERWLSHIKPNVSPNTFERYCDLARKNIVPLLGATVIAKLQAIQISEAYAKALSSGRRDGKGGLSPRTVHHMHRVLNQALGQAMRWGVLQKNPCAMLEKKDRPKVEKKPVSTIDAAANAQTIEEARELRLYVPILLASFCGLRRGEIAALRWRSIDFERGQLAVIASIEQTKAGCREKETKASKCRTVAMPAILVDELRSWRVRQAQELLRLGVRPDGDTTVVTQADGSSLQPRSLTHAVSAFMKARGLKVRLHGLRHSHASHLLAQNVHPKIVQERLGHSSIAITMDIYSHVMPNMQADAAAKIDAAFTAVRPKNGT